MLADLLNRRRRIFVLGLRVENRTITDLETFVRNFVRLCAEVVPGCAIVLDGHNAQRGGAGESRILSSHGQWSAKRQPIEVERELAAAAFEEANGRNVEIINLIGESVDRSMFWSFQADCFVAIWGAGLAKYRWVANCPGYIITSAWNRLHRPDLHIYSSHDFMDAPSEIQFVPADEIEDLPDAIQLVSFPTDQQSESYYNFAIKDHERLTFLRRYLADRG
jgi:hypothetical protein